MKIRQGFVSNSSSSSFICEVTGGSEGGYDVSLSDVEMSCCVNDHTFYNSYIIGEIDEDHDGYELPEYNCPICTMSHIRETDFLRYILKIKGIDVDMMKNQIRSLYANHKEFMEDLHES